LDILKNFRGLEPPKELFWSELNYQRVNQPILRPEREGYRATCLPVDREGGVVPAEPAILGPQSRLLL
jgi:hypothetical protein